MYYSKKNRFLFCHVPRTGGTSFSEHIRSHFNCAQRNQFQHLSMPAAKRLLGSQFDSLFKFAFVRNPWERLVSWHGLTAVAHSQFRHDLVPDTSPSSSHWRNFDKFLEQAVTKHTDVDGELRLEFSQFHQLADGDGNLLVDDLGRFENYSADSKRFLTKLGVDKSLPIKVNHSHHLHYSEYYSEFGRDLVAKVFHLDISKFGYEFECA